MSNRLNDKISCAGMIFFSAPFYNLTTRLGEAHEICYWH